MKKLLFASCAADQLLFHYTNKTIPLLPKSEISSLSPSSVVCVEPGQNYHFRLLLDLSSVKIFQLLEIC